MHHTEQFVKCFHQIRSSQLFRKWCEIYNICRNRIWLNSLDFKVLFHLPAYRMLTCSMILQHLKFYPVDLVDFVNKTTYVIVPLNMHFMETCLLTTCSLACISHFQHYTPLHLANKQIHSKLSHKVNVKWEFKTTLLGMYG